MCSSEKKKAVMLEDSKKSCVAQKKRKLLKVEDSEKSCVAQKKRKLLKVEDSKKSCVAQKQRKLLMLEDTGVRGETRETNWKKKFANNLLTLRSASALRLFSMLVYHDVDLNWKFLTSVQCFDLSYGAVFQNSLILTVAPTLV